MTWNFTPFSFLYLMAAAISFFSALVNWFRAPVVRHFRLLSVLLLMMALWLQAAGFELAAVKIPVRMNIIIFEDVIGQLIIILLLLFVVDYFEILPWFRGWWRRALWILYSLSACFSLTNPFHRLIWTGKVEIFADTNLGLYEHGPLYGVLNVFSLGLLMVIILLMVYQIVVSRGTVRRFSILLTASISTPFASLLVYVFAQDPYWANLFLPIGFSFAGIFTTWTTFEHLHTVIAEQRDALQNNVDALMLEIGKSKVLEEQMQGSREILASRLAEQSNKMAGFNELLLISSENLTPEELLDRSLSKAKELLGCTTLFFFRYEDSSLVLDSYTGPAQLIPMACLKLSSTWLEIKPGVQLVGGTIANPEVPKCFIEQGYQSGQFKWVILQDRILGMLAALWSEEYEFSVEEITLFSSIGDGIGLVLENARLGVVVTSEAKRQERRRLARDLHDSVTQSLYSIVLSSVNANVQAERGLPNLKETLQLLETSSRQALKEMRLLLYELRLSSISETNLIDAIRTRLEAIERRAGVELDLFFDADFFVPKRWEAELYAILMEALNNSLKHGRASHLSVHFTRQSGVYVISVADDGIGFDLSQGNGYGMGLKNMAERCARLDAQLKIATQPGQGTMVTVTLPVFHPAE